MRNGFLQPVLYVNGLILLVVAVLMWITAFVSGLYGDPDWTSFMVSSFIPLFLGGVLYLGNWSDHFTLRRSQGYLLTFMSWITLGVMGSIPLFIGILKLSFTDATFESFSALTTTGSTVIVGLDHLSHGVLLWRSLLQWIGGVGIIVTAMVMLPFLRVGGMQLFRSESSDISDKFMPRMQRLAAGIMAVYVALSVACAVCLVIAGMPTFDAICHAMATIATGGFSTKDASVGYYNSPAIEFVEIVFMTAGALPLVFYLSVFGLISPALKNYEQVRAFLLTLGSCILMMTLWLCLHLHYAFFHALRLAAFNVTSVLTDTGFASADFSTWGPFAIGLFFVIYFIGGCSGSTSGAVKIFRWQVLWRGMRRHLYRMLRPRSVMRLRYSNRVIDDDVSNGVGVFLFTYLLTFAALSLFLMAMNLDFITSASSVAQAMANAGPGLGKIVGPAGSFEGLPNLAKWVLVLAMVLGRLELFTVYLLLMPATWRE